MHNMLDMVPLENWMRRLPLQETLHLVELPKLHTTSTHFTPSLPTTKSLSTSPHTTANHLPNPFTYLNNTTQLTI